MMISDEMVEKYKKGTKPEDIATQSEVDEIQLLLMETINQTESDLENKILPLSRIPNIWIVLKVL
jgi:hypothetical protein